jgi:thiamine biosynthesis protein ThiS
MQISLNGERADTRGAETIAELVKRHDLVPESILIEHNGIALHRREWPSQKLNDGDRLEIIRVVAGG